MKKIMKKLFISALIASTASMAITSAATLTVGNRAGYGILNLDKLIIKTSTSENAGTAVILTSGSKIGVTEICNTGLTVCKSVTDLWTGTITAHNPTLAWNTTSNVATIRGTVIKVKLPAKPTVTVGNSGNTLSWGNTTTIGHVDGTALTIKMPSQPTDKDTHYTGKIVAGNSTATANGTTNNTNTYINYVENGTFRSGVQLQGAGGTTVAAKNGVITISSTGGGGGSLWDAGNFTAPTEIFNGKKPQIEYVTPKGADTKPISILLQASGDIYSNDSDGFNIFTINTRDSAEKSYNSANQVTFSEQGVRIGDGAPRINGVGLSVASTVTVGSNIFAKSAKSGALNNIIYIYATGDTTSRDRHYEVMGNTQLAVGTRYGSFLYFKPATETFISKILPTVQSATVGELDTNEKGGGHIIHGMEIASLYTYITDTYNTLNVGVNTDNPIATLDVNGTIKVGNNCTPATLPCDANHAGTMMYFTNSKKEGVLAFCTQKGTDSFSWVDLLGSDLGKTNYIQIQDLGYSQANHCIYPSPTPSNPGIIPVPINKDIAVEAGQPDIK